MSEIATYGFTKLVVDDLDAMSAFYCSVFGLHAGGRFSFDDAMEGERIEELSLATRPGEPYGPVTLLKYLDRPPVSPDGIVLGFTTPDVDGLVARALEAGGSLVGEVKAVPKHGIRIAFVRDPEGHLCELVEMTGSQG